MADPAAAALSKLPPGVTASWFADPLIPAAVLVPLIARGDDLSVLLTRRTEHLKDHPGQVSFPGGRVEYGDVDIAATALREVREELGIDRELVHVVGYLEPMAIVTGFVVTPVVGFVAAHYELQLDRFEVEEAFEVPLEYLLDPRNRVPTRRVFRGVEARWCEYHYDGHRIWGATALMLERLVKIIL